MRGRGGRGEGRGYPNGLCGSWGAGNEDDMLASSLRRKTTRHGLSAQLTAGHAHRNTTLPVAN